ncbi:hypothetical protein CDL15_Pgr027509 [Punica granatum]|uniref:Protein kinase domain-containing protein n=2 Tax=Punica granatum TaxID=22663 RepID=A0A218XK71_PUNGR|nr:hypothetical protein CDL15_Pgr027509 [Punica granatum]
MKKRYFLRTTHPPPSPLLAVILLLQICQCSSAYSPVDKIFINCGSTTNDPDNQGRLWIGDDDQKYAPLDPQKSLTSTAKVQPSAVSQVPYTTARLSRSEFSYSFPVTAGPKFVRLHFFPSNYEVQNFSPSDALFSVSSGPYSLLRNFSASLVADYLGNRHFFKEFCVVVEDNQRLDLTFTPGTDRPAAYALINGIEIVSMPPDLYYGNGTVDSSREVKFLDNNLFMTLSHTNALETVYRINVGTGTIDPKDDTGMFRSWTGPDDDYLTEDLSSVLPVNWSIPLVFDPIPEYAAPANVYKTARSIGTNRSITTTYNLTWSFPVDSNFLYLVRLHFCEFQREISKIGDRVFKIYIASQVADSRADVIEWTGGRGIPIYKDYAVGMYAQTSKKINLTVALHAGPEQYSVYADALLNGVEVFKISSNNSNLAGPNPDPTRDPNPPQQPPERTSSSGGISKNVIAAIAGGSVSGALVLGLLCFLTFWSRRSSKDSTYTDKTSLWGPLSYTTTKSTKTQDSSLPADLCRRFSLAEIKAATNGFDEIFIIGVGGFGNVYKGYVDGGSTTVAIKRLNPGSQQGAREFTTEIEMLSQLRHLHLVSLIGYCNDGGEMILVYDYMSHGTLRDHLYNTENAPLSWKQRLDICIGAARGLHYLHTGTKNMIIHRDMKTTNILLDDKWVAKVSDFGLSKIGPTNMPNSKDHVTTVVKGTFGYLDPEYLRRQQLTEKSDVYSFGVVLFEVLCARPPVNRTMEKKQISLASWAQSCYRNGTLGKIMDPNLRGRIAPECLKKFAEIAMSCLQDEGALRPSMNDVVWGLEFALQLQENAEGMTPKAAVTMGGAINEDEVPLNWTPSDSGSDFGQFISSGGEKSSMMTTTTSSSTSNDSQNLTGAVFSEIMNPQGR